MFGFGNIFETGERAIGVNDQESGPKLDTVIEKVIKLLTDKYGLNADTAAETHEDGVTYIDITSIFLKPDENGEKQYVAEKDASTDINKIFQELQTWDEANSIDFGEATSGSGKDVEYFLTVKLR